MLTYHEFKIVVSKCESTETKTPTATIYRFAITGTAE